MKFAVFKTELGQVIAVWPSNVAFVGAMTDQSMAVINFADARSVNVQESLLVAVNRLERAARDE